jgi:ubiquinone/menaquinone biosynthesis C-methylase UbiE
MEETRSYLQEQAASTAFSLQAPVFDHIYSSNTITAYKRMRVREHVSKFLQPHSSILELNAGTGDDAIWFAKEGHTVHATDISEGMQEILAQKKEQQALGHLISQEICSYTSLEELEKKGPYDHIFSNFAGLNCTDRLEKVLSSLSFLVKPGGHVTLVILPRFCLWEFLLLFKGKIKTAFRRFSGKKGTRAHIEGQYFRCWYYNPSFVTGKLNGFFEKVALEGLCTLVPPSYIEGFAEKYPSTFRFLSKKEDRWKSRWPWRSVGDYYIITLKKK